MNAFDDFKSAKQELERAKTYYRSTCIELIDSLRQYTIAEAFDMGLTKLSFSTEGMSKRMVYGIIHK